ncbi:hypothetical protein C8Q77DRAFT_1073052 [Trametes polyzona]|nr:hypothetical protein C8Q77DRAFT_1073052 [Trametes polyzona]
MVTKSLAVVAALGATAFAQTIPNPLQINTPVNPQQCQPSTISWSGSIGPYFLEILSGGQAIASWNQINASEFVWQTNVRAGTLVNLLLVDGKNQFTGSPFFTIQPGTDDCTLLN